MSADPIEPTAAKPATANPQNISFAMQLEWYRQMMLIRAFEEEVSRLNKGGRIPGTAHLYVGMEAIAVGACAVMLETDFLTSTHRGHGHCIARGLDPGRMMAEVLGRAHGYCGGKGGSMHIADLSRGMLGADGIVGGGIPIAVGAALGTRLQQRNTAIFCFFGDGAANQGSFHEGINLAAVLRLGVVFICENNLWALSAPFAQMTAGGSVAARAAGYGMPGETVDGNDVEAVYRAVSLAAARARGGAGPSLIECMTYRRETHSIFTRQENRPQDEIDAWRRRDPIALQRARLAALGQVSPEILDRIDGDVASEIAKAVAYAENSPVPEGSTAFLNVYAG